MSDYAKLEERCVFVSARNVTITSHVMVQKWCMALRGLRAVYQSMSANSFRMMSKFEFAITRNKIAIIQNWAVFQSIAVLE